MSLFSLPDRFASYIAEILNTDLIATRLIISVFLGYPIAFIYSARSKSWKIWARHLYLLSCGVLLFYWNFGHDIIHMFIGISVSLLMDYVLFQSKFAVLFSFVFNMVYLLWGSYICNRGTYDINWTTPYCVLCLRLIGLSWDLYDASKPEALRSAYQKRSSLSKFPGILETFAFCFTPTAFITGPQFPMRHYQAFIDNTLRPTIVLRNRSFMERFVYNVKVQRTIIRLTMGLLGIISLSKLLGRFPAETLLTEEFQNEWSFLSRILYMMIFVQLVLLRYVSIWLIGEGACIFLGLGCTGFVHIKFKGGEKNKDSNAKSEDTIMRDGPVLKRRDSAVEWSVADNRIKSLAELYDTSQVEICEAEHSACANVSLARYILSSNTDDLVAGFNINTNKWVLEYVYKRLKFLGNKSLSQILTLGFLALWHGLYTGYYVNFALEFIVVYVEKDFLSIVKKSKYNHFLYSTLPGKLITCILGKLHICFCLATPLVAFYLLQFKLWFPVFKSVYFVGFIYVLWPIAKPLVKTLLPPLHEPVHPYNTRHLAKAMINGLQNVNEDKTQSSIHRKDE